MTSFIHHVVYFCFYSRTHPWQLTQLYGSCNHKWSAYVILLDRYDYWITQRNDIDSLWSSDAIWRQIWVNICSGNGFLPYGTKPLPEPMLTDHQWSPVTFILWQFHKGCLNCQWLKSIYKIVFKFPKGQWVKRSNEWLYFHHHLHATIKRNK